MAKLREKLLEWCPPSFYFWRSWPSAGGRELGRDQAYLLQARAPVLDAMLGYLGDRLGRATSGPPACLAIVGAFLLAAASGVLLGTMMIAWSPVLSRALMPFLVFLNTLPRWPSHRCS